MRALRLSGKISFILLSLGFLIIGLNLLSKFNSNLTKPLCNNCNIILVSIDTLSSNHLPCYGYYRNTAPNLCKFADENVTFTDSHSNAPWTLPSHFSIFTSLYPQHHQVMMPGEILSIDIKTLPQILDANGYESIYVGPTNDLSLPLDKGLGRGFDLIYQHNSETSSGWDAGYKKLIENEKKNKRTFLFLHTYWVHSPYAVADYEVQKGKRLYTDKFFPQIYPSYDSYINDFSQEFIDFVRRNELNLPLNMIRKFENAKTNDELIKLFKSMQFTEQDYFRYNYYLKKLKEVDPSGEYARALYDERIVSFDHNLISSLLNLIKGKEIAKNTMLIITSDHGEEFAEHGFFGHPIDDLYNSVTSTPLIMYIPGIKQKKVSDMVESVDIVPTLLGLIGVKTSVNFDGIDLTGSILNKFNYKRNNSIISGGADIDSIRNGYWKLYIQNSTKGDIFHLFNLTLDPGEKKDVSKTNKTITKNLADTINRVIYRDGLK